MSRPLRLLGWSYVAICLVLIALAMRSPRAAPAHAAGPNAGTTASAAQWFRRVKPYCNAVEITVLQRQAPPPGVDGAGYHAACFAIAGKIDEARKIIDALPTISRHTAVGIVFDVGHPVADAGDDRSAGPIMELVVDYWPNHYMALYHAGMAEYMLGQRALAQKNLESFLKFYHENDGWRSNALEVLKRLKWPVEAADLRRPREPGK